MEEFGQAPAQLFPHQHPARLSLTRAEIVRPIASAIPGAHTAPLSPSDDVPSPVEIPATKTKTLNDGTGGRPMSYNVISFPRERVSRGPVLFISDVLPDRLVTVDARRAIGVHGWRVYSPEMSPPFRLRPGTIEDALHVDDGGNGLGVGYSSGGGAGGGGSNVRVRRLGVPFAPSGVLSSRLLGPPPARSSGHGDGTCVEDGDGGLRTLLPRGLGGSYDSLASIRMILSLPHPAIAPASEPLRSPGCGSEARAPCPVAQLNGLNGGRCHRPENVNSSADTSVTPTGDQKDRGSGVGSTGNSEGGGVGLGSHLFAVHAESRMLFSGGHWDSSFRVTSLDTGRLVVSIARHRDVVTSLSLVDGGMWSCRLATASGDTTIMVWRVDHRREPPVTASSLLHVLYGHDAPVTCVCASASMDVVVSSGEDGTVVVHTLWNGEYIRTIRPRLEATPTASLSPDGNLEGSRGLARDVELAVLDENKSISVEEGQAEHRTNSSSSSSRKSESTADTAIAGATRTFTSKTEKAGSFAARAAVAGATTPASSGTLPVWPSVEWVGLSSAGYVVAYSSMDATLRSYTINGHALGCVKLKAEAGWLHAFVFSEDGAVLLSGGDDGVVTLRWVHSLEPADDDARAGCGEAVLSGASPPLPGVPGAAAGVKRFGSPVRSLALTAGERHLLVGLDHGMLGVLALDAKYLRQRLRSRLDQLGI